MLSRLLSYLRSVYRNRNRLATDPRFLTYTVTFGCNAKCIMCDSWKMTTDGDLSLAEVESIFRQLPPMDGIRLTGGEPFVRRDMVDIARLAVEHLRPMFIHVTTNGFLTNRVVEFCEQRPRQTPLEVLVSIDGIGEKHNTIRGNSNAFNTCMETVRALAPRRKELNLKLAVNQTIVDVDGIEHYKLLREALKPLGVHNHIVMAYDMSATYNLEREVEIAPTEIGEFTTFGEFTDDHLRELLNEVERDISQYPLMQRLAKRYYVRGIRNRLLHNSGTPNPPCTALNSHLRIFPNGDIPTCQFNSKTIGNLRDDSFAEIWQSHLASQQRNWVRKCPGCWAECEVLPNAVYSGDLLVDLLRPSPRDQGGNRLKPRPVAQPDLPVVDLGLINDGVTSTSSDCPQEPVSACST